MQMKPTFYSISNNKSFNIAKTRTNTNICFVGIKWRFCIQIINDTFHFSNDSFRRSVVVINIFPKLYRYFKAPSARRTSTSLAEKTFEVDNTILW